MSNDRIYNMSFSKVYPLLIAKAEKKGRERNDVIRVTAWLTGYTEDEIEACLLSNITYGDFFRDAPVPNPKRVLIRGSVCGVRLEEVDEPLMREIRYLDKLVDELAKGKAIDKIFRG